MRLGSMLGEYMGIQWGGLGVVVRLTSVGGCRSGKNNYRDFNCYRDNGHQLYNDGTFSCFSIYYCLDVS